MPTRFVILVIIPFFLFALKQEIAANGLIPENLEIITVDNAAQIRELASMGGSLQGQLVWSPDNIHLAVGTSEGIQVYDSQNLGTPPTQIDANGWNFTFNPAGEIVVDGQRWGIDTGELISAVESTAPVVTPDISVSSNRTDDALILTFSKADGSTSTLSIDSHFELWDIIYSNDKQFAVLVFLDAGYDPEYAYQYYVSLQLWNIEDGTFIANLPPSTTLDTLGNIRFFADGNLIVISGNSEEYSPYVFVFDGQTGRNHTGCNASIPIYFSPNGELFAFRIGGDFSIWSDHELGMLSFPFEDWDNYMQFSPDSKTIATRRTRAILLWDVSNEEIPEEPYLNFETETAINDLLYSPDGRYLASIERDGIAEVFEAQTGIREARLSVEGDFAPNGGVKFSPDGQFLWARNDNGDAYILDIENDITRMVELFKPSAINSDWTYAAYWDSGIVRIMLLETGEASDIDVIDGYLGGIFGFSPDSGLVMFRETAMSFGAYDIYSGEKYFEHGIPENSYYQVQFNEGGTQFILINDSRSYNSEASIEIWGTTNWTEPIASVTETGFLGYEFLYSPDNRYISELWGVCGHGGGGSFSLRDAQTGQKVNFFPPDGLCGPYDHAFTPDSEWLLVAWDRVIHINYVDDLLQENMDSDDYVPQSTGIAFNRYNYKIKHIRFSPNAELLVVTFDGVQNWIDVPSNSTEIPLTPEPKIDIFRFSDILATEDHIAESLSIASIPNATQALFSPDSQWLLTGMQRQVSKFQALLLRLRRLILMGAC